MPNLLKAMLTAETDFGLTDTNNVMQLTDASWTLLGRTENPNGEDGFLPDDGYGGARMLGHKTQNRQAAGYSEARAYGVMDYNGNGFNSTYNANHPYDKQYPNNPSKPEEIRYVNYVRRVMANPSEYTKGNITRY